MRIAAAPGHADVGPKRLGCPVLANGRGMASTHLGENSHEGEVADHAKVRIPVWHTKNWSRDEEEESFEGACTRHEDEEAEMVLRFHLRGTGSATWYNR